jgi:hypothetical protein
MLDKPKSKAPPPENPIFLQRARTVHEDKAATRRLREAQERKAEVSARLKRLGGTPLKVRMGKRTPARSWQHLGGQMVQLSDIGPKRFHQNRTVS